MLRKTFLIVVLLVGILGLSRNNVHAGYPASIGGWGSWPGSVTVWSYWKGITNADQRPTLVSVTIKNMQVILHYLNPGNNGGGDGQPFYPNIELAQQEYLDSATADRNGWYYSEITFYDENIIDQLDPTTLPPPPNPQWTIDRSKVTVLSFTVRIDGWSDTNSDQIVDTRTTYVEGNCTLDADGSNYTCDQTADWYIRSKGK